MENLNKLKQELLDAIFEHDSFLEKHSVNIDTDNKPFVSNVQYNNTQVNLDLNASEQYRILCNKVKQYNELYHEELQKTYKKI